MEDPMRKHQFESDPIPESVHEAIGRAEKLAEQRVWGRAHQILSGVADELERMGIESHYVLWLLAVACDSSGSLEDAVANIGRARATDLANSRALQSEQIILGHVYTLLDVAGPNDPEVLSLIETVRQNFPASHPGLRQIEEKLAEGATADSGQHRAVA
jgi:hypothetical protein